MNVSRIFQSRMSNRRTKLLLLAVALFFSVMPQISLADQPDINITSPTTGTNLFFSSFPATASVTFTVQHTNLSDLNALDIKVDEVSIFGGAKGNPFPSNLCSSTQMIPAAGITSCTTVGTTNANATASWTIPEPGTYAIVASVKHQGATDTDTEENIVVQLVNVEYPAPPAGANAYINAEYGKAIGPKLRGCIISKIADYHARASLYGPKGGLIITH